MGQENLTGIDQKGRSYFEETDMDYLESRARYYPIYQAKVHETPEQLHKRLGIYPYRAVLVNFKGHEFSKKFETFELAQMWAERHSTHDARFDEELKAESGIIYRFSKVIGDFKAGKNFSQWVYRNYDLTFKIFKGGNHGKAKLGRIQ